MRVLLDTSTIVWAAENSQRLRASARDAIDAADEVQLSVVSVWEIAIKVGRGKLEFDFEALAQLRSLAANVAFLDVTLPHVLGVNALPHHHRDPFDRLLIAQARHEALTIVTNDIVFRRYDVETVW